MPRRLYLSSVCCFLLILPITATTQKAGFPVPKTVLWLIKHLFFVSTFVLKIRHFPKPRTVTKQNVNKFVILAECLGQE